MLRLNIFSPLFLFIFVLISLPVSIQVNSIVLFTISNFYNLFVHFCQIMFKTVFIEQLISLKEIIKFILLFCVIILKGAYFYSCSDGCQWRKYYIPWFSHKLIFAWGNNSFPLNFMHEFLNLITSWWQVEKIV